MKELNLNFKTYKVILFFICVLFLFGSTFLGIINNVILMALPLLIFLGPIIIWTLNFIYLFRKKSPLVIKEQEIIYSVIGLKIENNDIRLISLTNSKSLILEIHLNNFEKYKIKLNQTFFGKILLLNYKIMGKNSISINVSVFDIKKNELSEKLKKFFPKNKILF